MNLYEAMFVVNHNAAKESYEKTEAEVLACITRHGGEIVNSLRWDDRRLAYEIKKHKRGTYILVHFNAPGEAIQRIEKQARLCEVVLRCLIIADEDGAEAAPASKAREEAEVRGERGDRRGGRGGRRDDREGRPAERTDRKEEATATETKAANGEEKAEGDPEGAEAPAGAEQDAAGGDGAAESENQ